jgi:hypothetical protein
MQEADLSAFRLVIVAAIMLTEQLLELVCVFCDPFFMRGTNRSLFSVKVYIWNDHRRSERRTGESKKDPNINSEMGAQAFT